MKKHTLIALFIALASQVSQAKTVCSMTFNSADEKQVFKQYLTPMGYEQVELVPQNKDPEWFSKACASVKTCDILVISGHFGGIFFGEQSSATISLNELISARDKSLCPSILDKPKSVFLMGCNTMASKLPDHRNVSDYLRVLTGDGFPLNLAEDVAAARYLNFGQSMSEIMSRVFNKTELLVGFDSTGPLGAQAAPKLKKAFDQTSAKDKNITGISRDAILSAFKGTNLRAIKPELKTADLVRQNALSQNIELSKKAWQEILTGENISKYYDFLVKNQNNPVLAGLLLENASLAQNTSMKMVKIYQTANGLSEIQVKVLDFLKLHNLINFYVYEDSIRQIGSNILAKTIDYISADQLCTLLKRHKDLNLLSKFTPLELSKLKASVYGEYLNKCAGNAALKPNLSKAYQCLVNKTTHDWACLTENTKDLNVEACALAKGRNPDAENSDDMMWFCYSKMNELKYLKRATCLELTHHFSLLGNQIKMNWNCLNRVVE